MEKAPPHEAEFEKELEKKEEKAPPLGFFDIPYMRTFCNLLIFFVITIILNLAFAYFNNPDIFKRKPFSSSGSGSGSEIERI